MRKIFKKMNIKPIKTENDYRLSLKRLDEIFDAKAGSENGDEFEVLSILIERYEDSLDKFPLPDPIEAIRFRMEQMGYNQSDLNRTIGSKSRASEILNRKRKLSLNMIRKIHEKLNIPTDILIQPY